MTTHQFTSEVSPHQLCIKHTHSTRKTARKTIYVGIELEPLESTPQFCIYIHDGYSGIDYEIKQIKNAIVTEESSSTESDLLRAFQSNLDSIEDEIIVWLSNYQKLHNAKISAAGIGVSFDFKNLCRSFGEIYLCERVYIKSNFRLPWRIWSELDILPIISETIGKTVDERACSAIRKALPFIAQGSIGCVTHISVGFRHRVEVDHDGRIHYADLQDYQNITKDHVWKSMMHLVTNVSDLKVSFLNSTSQGGGVATMRHALLRFFSLLNLNINWYVARPNPEVFEITKLKIHNVLQGIAPMQMKLSLQDIEIYEQWCLENVHRDWEHGPFKDSDIIVVDDPQLVGCIPYIQKMNPKAKIIFRMHIQLDTEKLKISDSNTSIVWRYISEKIKDCDAYVWHPIEESIPSNSHIPKEKLWKMPASFDRLDGLNKHMNENVIEYYQNAFNYTTFEMLGKRIDFKNRPLISQFCRFDPSKGIIDVIKAYVHLRSYIDRILPLYQIPQLLITGFGSIDDPEANIIYENTICLLNEEEFIPYERDILVVKLPSSDQLMNALMRSTTICLQLSLHEGFEIKVSEAIVKGIPVIAYKTGGIVNQIENGKNGFLVETGDFEKVAVHLQLLLTDKELYSQISSYGSVTANDEFSTVFQATNWFWLFYYVMGYGNDSSIKYTDVKRNWLNKP